MNHGILLLTSTGLSCEKVAKKIQEEFFDIKNISIAIITTAAEGKEKNKYSQLAKKQFSDIGFEHIDFIDFEIDPIKNLSGYNIFYVCGGNTFKLLKFARKADFKSSIENLLKRNGIYIGVSAGSIIVGPSIEIASEVSADKNEISLEDLSGFNITNLIILPHYSAEIEEEAKAFETKYNVTVERISNSQAILVENRQRIVIE